MHETAIYTNLEFFLWRLKILCCSVLVTKKVDCLSLVSFEPLRCWIMASLAHGMFVLARKVDRCAL
jgi:hypothetical protein